MKSVRAAILIVALASASGALAAGSGYRVIDRISGPDGGWDYVRVDQPNNRVLVAHGTSVMAVDLASKAVTPGLAPGVRLHDALPVNRGAEVLVTNGGNDTAVFMDSKSGASVATVKTGKNPDAEVFDIHSGLVLVMDHSGGQITLVDPKAHAVVATIEVGGDLEAAAVDGAGKAFVNVEDKNQIAVIDIGARKVVARYALAGCDGPTGIAYDAADKQLIAACDGSTVVVSAVTGKVLATARTGAGADGVAFDPKQRLAFVPSGRGGTLAVVAIGPGQATIIDTVPTQVGARTLALDPRTGRIYLPTAKYAAAVGGARPAMVPGSFELLVVGK